MTNKFIYPCSISFYNVESHFRTNDKIVWRKTSDIKKGDIVYIYIGKPYLEIKYKCVVINDKVDRTLLSHNAYAIPKGKIAARCTYLQMKLEYTYPEGTFILAELKAHGLGQFMVPMHAPSDLVTYISRIESKIVNFSGFVGGETYGN